MDKNKSKDSNESKKEKLKIAGLIALIILLIAAIIGCIVYINKNNKEKEEKKLPYTELIKEITNKNVEKIEMEVGSTSAKITLKGMKEGEEKTTSVPNTEVFKDLKMYSYQADDGKWGYKDKNGNIVVDCRYDFVTELNQYGYAGIYQEGRWGVINSDGKVVVIPSYEISTYYSPSFLDRYLLQEQYGAQCIEVQE